MSAKARTLRKRLKQKEDPKESEGNISTPAVKLRPAATLQETKKKPMLFKAPKRRRDSYIDPLEYFQKEHLIIKEDKMEEYLVEEDKVIEEEGKKEERPKPKGGMMMMMGMPIPMGGPKGGMPGMGFKINFEEMMKARSKIKKEPIANNGTTQRPSSVKPRSGSKKEREREREREDEPDNDEEPKRKEGDEQNLYIKLVMARNKYNELSSAKTNVFDKIMKQIQELRQINDLPPKYREKVDEFESKLKIPERLILDPDVQEIENDEYEKIVKEPVKLDNIINSLNLSTN